MHGPRHARPRTARTRLTTSAIRTLLRTTAAAGTLLAAAPLFLAPASASPPAAARYAVSQQHIAPGALRAVVESAAPARAMAVTARSLIEARSGRAAQMAAAARQRALPRRMRAFDWAMAQRRCWYAWGGSGPCGAGFDCSGLVMRAWQAAGRLLPRTTYEMLASGMLRQIPESQARRGDLGFFGSGHVELVAYAHDGHVRWTLGALEPGTRVGAHRSSAWWHPTEFFEIR